MAGQLDEGSCSLSEAAWGQFGSSRWGPGEDVIPTDESTAVLALVVVDHAADGDTTSSPKSRQAAETVLRRSALVEWTLPQTDGVTVSFVAREPAGLAGFGLYVVLDGVRASKHQVATTDRQDPTPPTLSPRALSRPTFRPGPVSRATCPGPPTCLNLQYSGSRAAATPPPAAPATCLRPGGAADASTTTELELSNVCPIASDRSATRPGRPWTWLGWRLWPLSTDAWRPWRLGNRRVVWTAPTAAAANTRPARTKARPRRTGLSGTG
jgi:hypothetical protein